MWWVIIEVGTCTVFWEWTDEIIASEKCRYAKC